MYLGIDLGTSEAKVLLLTEGGAIVGAAGVPAETAAPQPPRRAWRGIPRPPPRVAMRLDGGAPNGFS